VYPAPRWRLASGARIGALSQELGTGERQGYATTMAGLLGGLTFTLGRLEELASDPDETLADADALTSFPGLQYTLHEASETAAGIDPPAHAEESHAELAAALADARDATAEVADAAAAGGPDAAWPLVYEWRGALFRVRLARMRLGPTPARPEEVTGDSRRKLFAGTVAIGGGLVLALGAVLADWLLAASPLP
jgi:hypothetical protein